MDTTTAADRSAQPTLARLVELIRMAIDEQDYALVDWNGVRRETTLRSLPLDSLATVELLASIEETFDLVIDEDAAFDFQTVGDVPSYVEAH